MLNSLRAAALFIQNKIGWNRIGVFLSVAIIATAVALLSGGDRAMRAVIMLCALLFAASTALAFYHVGVEQHWFAGPSACTGSVTVSSTSKSCSICGQFASETKPFWPSTPQHSSARCGIIGEIS